MTGVGPSAPIDEATRREQVRERYGRIARGAGDPDPSASAAGCCGGGDTSSCCSDSDSLVQLGYRTEDLADLPDGANLGLGCGNPTGLLELRAGEVVLDLGSGAGIDSFLAAKKVGPGGRVIGVDMTPEMISKARANARRAAVGNVEFRLGEIEHLPVADRSIDVVISNCVINLVPDKSSVYRDAYRVLRPGGRLAISDVVATRPITPEERADPSLWSSCSSGALEIHEVEAALREAGFDEVDVRLRASPDPPDSLEGQAALGVVPADIRATKRRE